MPRVRTRRARRALRETAGKGARRPLLPTPSFIFSVPNSYQHRGAGFRTFRMRLGSDGAENLTGFKKQGQGRSGTLSRDRLRGGRPKTSPTPLCVLIDARPFVSGIRPRSGWVPGEASSAQLLRGGYLGLKGGVGINVMTGVDPGYLNAGLMKPRRGFTLVAGNENWGWAR